MSIFGIIGLTFLIALLVFAVGMLIVAMCDDYSIEGPLWPVVILIISVIVWIAGIFIGIGINTESEQVYISKYEIQKTTIEQSLNSETLSGLERIELVNKAIDLNGELANRKAVFDLWHTVYYDNSIYDNVEFIKFE